MMEHVEELASPGTRTGPFRSSSAPPLLAFFLGLLLLAVTACAPQDRELPPADHVYDSQGVVYGVTQVDGRRPELVIHHQAIPEFVSRHGEVSGMDSMTMPFTVAPGIDLDAIEEGAPVAFRFEVRWEGDPTLLVTALEPLPPGTVIDFAPGERAEPAPEAVEVPEPGGEHRSQDRGIEDREVDYEDPEGQGLED